MNWNDDWREELKTDYYPVWERLAECRNTRKDIIIMAKLNYKYNRSKEPEECLNRIVEWVTDWNGQSLSLIPDEEEKNEILKQL